MDLGPIFAEKPAIHRFPGAMATRVRELAAVVTEDYGGDAARIWSEASDSADLKRRIGALPGFGEMKISRSGRCSQSGSASRRPESWTEPPRRSAT